MSNSGFELLSVCCKLVNILPCLLVLLFDLGGVLQNLIAPLLNSMQFVKLAVILLLELASIGSYGLRFIPMKILCS